MMDVNRIGILGGTFNPVHFGHLVLAQSAYECIDLSKVLFVPSNMPPHKKGFNLASAEHRKAMIDAAIEDDLRFELNDIELKRKGASYSIDTVMELKRESPKAEIVFIIGQDTLPELHTWKRIYDLLALCRFVTFRRPGVDKIFEPSALKLDAPWPEKLLKDVHEGVMVDVSSTDIRYRIAEGMSIRYLVPVHVEMYILEHRLYRT